METQQCISWEGKAVSCAEMLNGNSPYSLNPVGSVYSTGGKGQVQQINS